MNIQKYLIWVMCVLQASGLFAQSREILFKEINDQVMAKYNEGDYESIFARGKPNYEPHVNVRISSMLLDNLKWKMGKALSSELIADLGDTKYFKWTCKTGNIRFELRMEDTSIISIEFNKLVLQPNALERTPLNNNPLKTKLDSIVDGYARIYMSDSSTVGLTIGVYYEGKKNLYYYGEKEKGSGKPVNDQTIFSLGSPFIDGLLARAFVEKKLSPDDDIRKYLGGNFPGLQVKSEPLTLLGLITGKGAPLFGLITTATNQDSWTKQQWESALVGYNHDSLLLRDLYTLKLDTLATTRYHYLMIPSILLCMALEKVYHQSIDQIIRKYYDSAFHMTATKIVADSDDITHYATRCDYSGHPIPQKSYYTTSFYPVNSTAPDMMNYVQANVEEQDPAVRLTHQVIQGDRKSRSRGMGWWIQQVNGKYERIWQHGYDPGSNSMWMVYPELKLGLFLWTNTDSTPLNINDVERSIRETILWWNSQNETKN